MNATYKMSPCPASERIDGTQAGQMLAAINDKLRAMGMAPASSEELDALERAGVHTGKDQNGDYGNGWASQRCGGGRRVLKKKIGGA